MGKNAIDGTWGFVYAGERGVGVGVGVFTVERGVFKGADFGGVKYQGHVTEDANGQVKVKLRMDVPAEVLLVQGASGQELPYSKEGELDLPPEFGGGRPVELFLAPGPVTVMVRRIPDENAIWINGAVVTPKRAPQKKKPR